MSKDMGTSTTEQPASRQFRRRRGCGQADRSSPRASPSHRVEQSRYRLTARVLWRELVIRFLDASRGERARTMHLERPAFYITLVVGLGGLAAPAHARTRPS